ncbi:hypothetical protein L3X38_011483 [Prunus dulcis]|uniref:Integrase zinc-binding domain-containing protein n=1 Tax=Prunus dulcis TaxID=3755 RepID=A0AAD4WKA2_PRUDU|nr:hypothetical protein L3X38_011483 [Prunus dulcis]
MFYERFRRVLASTMWEPDRWPSKPFRRGYYWPILHSDVVKLVRKCDQCQRFGSILKQSAEPLTPMVIPGPFAQWRLDLIGPIPQGKGQL